KAADNADTNDYFRPVISTITFQPASLFGSVLPRGYGFAILDGNGRVLFHSDTQRNLRENFVVEAGGCKRLLSDIRSRTEDDFTQEYLNQTYHLAVLPVKGMNLTVVAFRNKDIQGKLTTNIVVNAAMLLLLYALAIVLAIVAAGLAVRGWMGPTRARFSWLWP